MLKFQLFELKMTLFQLYQLTKKSQKIHIFLLVIQYPIRIPIFGLKQPNLDPRSVPIQQAMTVALPINILVANGQLVYGNGVSFHQPIKVNPHSQLDGEPPKDSPNGGLPRKRSPTQDLFEILPLDPPIGLYEWLTPDPRFMPLWFQQVVIQFEPTSNMPY